MGKRLIHLETGEPAQYIEGETFYSEEFWHLVEGELTDEMVFELMMEQSINKNEQNTFNSIKRN